MLDVVSQIRGVVNIPKLEKKYKIGGYVFYLLWDNLFVMAPKNYEMAHLLTMGYMRDLMLTVSWQTSSYWIHRKVLKYDE
jgi:hypothetical protein